MHLTRFTDLGLRTMMLLAAAETDGRRITTRTIANGADASENHIAKAVSRLVELGMVNARRGRVGDSNSPRPADTHRWAGWSPPGR